jgi:hypothetical protein
MSRHYSTAININFEAPDDDRIGQNSKSILRY